MAYPRELVQTVASSLGLAESSVQQLDRQLQEAGLRRKGGRGRSSIKVDAADAATLLCGIGGAPLFGAAIARSAETVRAFMDLPIQSDAIDAHRSLAAAADHIPHLATLPAKHCFGDALKIVVEAATLGQLNFSFPVSSALRLQTFGRVEVRFARPGKRAAILVFGASGWSGSSYFDPRDLPATDQDLSEWAAEYEKRAPRSDLQERRVFGSATLDAIGKLLAREKT